MTDTLERVARTLCRVAGSNPDDLHQGHQFKWECYTDAARAAAEALLEPTPQETLRIAAKVTTPITLSHEGWTRQVLAATRKHVLGD